MISGRAKLNPGALGDDAARTPAAAGASGHTDPRAIKSGQALRAAMLNLLEHKPLEQITIREIAATAGVHYATFFRHHPTKESLLDEVAADQIDRMVAMMTVPVMGAVDWHASFQTLAAYVEEHRKLWRVLLTGGAAGAMRIELLRVSQAAAIKLATQDDLIPLDLAVLCTVGLIIEIVSWWLRQPEGAVSVEQVALILHRAVQHPHNTAG